MKLFDIIQVKSGLLANDTSKEFCLNNGGFCNAEKPFYQGLHCSCKCWSFKILSLFHVLVFCGYLENANKNTS